MTLAILLIDFISDHSAKFFILPQPITLLSSMVITVSDILATSRS